MQNEQVSLELILLISEVLNYSCNYVFSSISYVYMHSVIVIIQSYFDIVLAKAYIYFSDESLHISEILQNL